MRGWDISAARLLEGVNRPRPTAYVDSPPLVVEEEVVGVVTGRQISLGCSGSGFKQHETRGDPIDYADDPRSPAKSQGKVREMSGAPARERAAGIQVDDDDLVRVRNVHERLSALAIDLEALRVSAEPYGSHDGAAGSVKDRQSARTIADHDLPGLWIDPHIVSIVAKRHRTSRREGVGVEKANRPVASRGNHELIAIRQISKPLWFLQSLNPARLARRQIDPVDRSVAKLRHKEALVWNINRKMINAP
jgi:hypothetical protein